MKQLLLISCSFFFLIADSLLAQNRGLIPEDYYHFQFVSDPQISPDGTQIAFVRSVVSENRRSREGAIWMTSVSGDEQPRQFTMGTSDRSPRWRPDGGALAFMSARDGSSKIWKIPANGGEAQVLFETDHGIAEFHWSPDGKKLLLRLSVSQNADDENDEPKPDIRVVTTSLYKADGVGILPKRRAHLFVYDIGSEKLQQLTDGADWNANSPRFSPDGKTVLYQANKSGDEYEGGFSQQLYTIPADSGEVVQITKSDGRVGQPAWSPNGNEIAFTYTEGRYEPTQIYVIRAQSGQKRLASDQLDHHPGNLQWDRDGRSLYFESSYRGSNALFQIQLRNGRIQEVLPGRFSISQVRFSENGRQLAFIKQDHKRLPEVWTSTRRAMQPNQRTECNTALLDSMKLSDLEDFWFTNDSGSESHGFLLKPVDWQEGETYPLVLNIKGGPGGMWGFQWFQEFQMMAAQGYAVFFTNYRGSHGYGFAHQGAVFQDYGGADYRDNIVGLEYVLENYDWIDQEQLHITGGSHGGFLTNWITARHPELFRTAVTQRSVSNWISEAGTQSYVPQAMREEFGGTIWENFDLYWGRSPLKYANQVQTPTLIIHSDRDHITPIGQAEEWFYALKINDVPVEMVVFQGESHGLSRTGTPVNLVERLHRIMDWFSRDFE